MNGTSRNLRLCCGPENAIGNGLVSRVFFSPSPTSVSLRRNSLFNGTTPSVFLSVSDSETCLGNVSVAALVVVSPDRLFKASDEYRQSM